MNFSKTIVVFLLSAVSVTLALESSARCEELAGWWRFEEEGNVVRDFSAKGNDGVASEAEFSEGRRGKAMVLEGEGGLEVPRSPSLRFDKPFTIECWIKPTDLSAAEGAINIMGCDGEFLLRIDPIEKGRNISFFVACGGILEPRVRGTPPEEGKWHHVIAVWNGRRAFLWVDGAEFSVKRTGRIAPSQSPLLIGGRSRWAGAFTGLIDEVRVYGWARSPGAVQQMIWMPDGHSAGDRVEHLDFGFPEDMKGWERRWGAELVPDKDCLRMKLATERSALFHSHLDVSLSGNESVLIRMAIDRGRIGEVTMFTSEGQVISDFLVTPDGKMRDYFVRPDSEKWNGQLLALGIRPSDEAGARCGIELVKIVTKPPVAAPNIVISEFAPFRRINQVAKSAEAMALLRNDGGAARNVTACVVPPAGVQLIGKPERLIEALDAGQEIKLHWHLRSAQEVRGDVQLIVSLDGREVCRAERCVEFSNDARTATLRMWRERAFLKAGYPRAMDFRHLGPESIATFECQTALLVDFIGDKIEAAREFKKRYPDRLVLMQVNDEANGLWGSWCTVPREFALKEGLRCRPDVFPMPEFRGYWLLMPGDVTGTDITAQAEEVEVSVAHPERFVRVVRGAKHFPDVLIYTLKDGRPDWLRSEYASVVSVDIEKGSICLKRWPRIEGYRWYGYRRGEAYVAPSAGDIYWRDPVIKTWIPNLTKFCPRDPETGLDAAEWWARHFANLWHDKIARDQPHADGYEFDMPPFRAHNKHSDCNNDGEVDACEFDGISYWGLGMHRFFHLLRSGTKDWKGIGWDALLLSDSSGTSSQRSFGVLNGSENEEFVGFGRAEHFSPQFDLYLFWCHEARSPKVSYLQSRFPCEIYFDGSLHEARGRAKFRMSNNVRLAIAAACMGMGIHTYRHGERSDIDMILRGGGRMRFDWDEYHAGSLNRYNWLGDPAGKAERLPGSVALGPLFREDFETGAEGWSSEHDAAAVAISPITLVQAEGGGRAMRCGVEQISVTRPARETAILLSPSVGVKLSAGKEYVVRFDVGADPQYDEQEGALYSDIRRDIGVQLQVGEARSLVFHILVGHEWRTVRLTFVAPASGEARVAFHYGAELGPLLIDDVELREGCAEVMYRLFEHGMVLMNGSRVSSYAFDLSRIGGGRKYRRLSGTQDPTHNNGRPVESPVAVALSDALFLIGE